MNSDCYRFAVCSAVCFWLLFIVVVLHKYWAFNRPRSIYQYSNMAPRLSGQTSIFGVVFFVSKSLLGIERQKKLEKFAILTRKPRSHARILIYRTWPIVILCFKADFQSVLRTLESLFMLFVLRHVRQHKCKYFLTTYMK